MNKILIIVNPKSTYFNENIINNLKIALNNKYYLIKYTYSLDDFNEQLNNLINFTSLLIVGGDGTVFHAVQFILSNNIDIYIGHIPTGSGNGLTKSLLFSKNIKFNSNNAINNVLNLEKKNIDVMEIELHEQNLTIYSFLFISCGIFSNIDVGTDILKFIGNIRFTIGAIKELMMKNCFYATLEYDKYENNQLVKNRITGNFIFFMANNLSHTSDDTHTSPGSLPNDGLIKINYLLEPCSRFKLTKLLLGLEDGSFLEHVNTINTNNFKLITNDSYLDIDGEYYPSQTISVKLLNNKLNLHY